MIVRSYRVADIMKQGAHHIFFVHAGAMGECRRLKRMGEAVDWKTPMLAFQLFKM